MTYNYLLKLIQNKEPFSFSRFGDGEWNAIYRDRKSTQNCDSHTYFPDMGDRLRGVLENFTHEPNYYLALQSMAKRQRPEQIETMTETYGINWTESNILHRANIKGRLNEFFNVLNERKVLLVGARHLKKLYPDYLHSFNLVEIPSKNCWNEYEKIKQELETLLALEIFKDAVVVYAASMMSNVLIDDFHGIAHTQIDAGSVFDPYCGVNSRTYHKNLKI